jgi:hypothetical protein
MSDQANEMMVYAQTDHARTHKASASNAAEKVDKEQLQEDWESLQRNSYVIFEDVLDVQQIRSIKADIVPRLSHTGRNNFEGLKTQRLYGRTGEDARDRSRGIQLFERIVSVGEGRAR